MALPKTLDGGACSDEESRQKFEKDLAQEAKRLRDCLTIASQGKRISRVPAVFPPQFRRTVRQNSRPHGHPEDSSKSSKVSRLFASSRELHPPSRPPSPLRAVPARRDDSWKPSTAAIPRPLSPCRGRCFACSRKALSRARVASLLCTARRAKSGVRAAVHVHLRDEPRRVLCSGRYTRAFTCRGPHETELRSPGAWRKTV